MEKNNFVRALDKATKYESETLHPEKPMGGYNMGPAVSVKCTTINKVRPQKEFIKVDVKDIVRSTGTVTH